MKLPANPLIYEILEAAGKARSKAEKIKILKSHDSWALRDVLRATYDDKVEFIIPGGDPPYTPNKPESIPSNLLRKNVDFKYIIKNSSILGLTNINTIEIIIDKQQDPKITLAIKISSK